MQRLRQLSKHFEIALQTEKKQVAQIINSIVSKNR